MSAETVRDLLRSLEQTLHERLRTIEDVVVKSSYGSGSSDRLGTAAIVDVEDRLKKIINRQSEIIEGLVSKVDSLTAELSSIKNGEFVKNHILPKSPLEGIEVVPKKEIVLSVENSELEPISAADRLLLNKKARKVLEAVEMGETQLEDHPTIEEEEIVEEEVEEEVAEEEVEEEVVEEEVEEEVAEEEVEEEVAEEVVEEEVAEEGALELEEFEYKGSTYYKDPENNVYMMDEEGELIEDPIGVWSEVKKRIIVKKGPTA